VCVYVRVWLQKGILFGNILIFKQKKKLSLVYIHHEYLIKTYTHTHTHTHVHISNLIMLCILHGNEDLKAKQKFDNYSE